MDNAVREKMYGVAAILVILAALFFQFDRYGHQKIVQKQSGDKNIERTLEASSSDTAIRLEEKSQSEKTIPLEIPILMYHYVRDYVSPSDPIGENLSVTPKKFEEQIAWLKGNGYRSVSLDSFETPQPVSFKPIVLTFDDGYQDAFDVVFPVLKKYELSGVFYLIVNKIGTPGYLTWDEIVRMQADGMSFGSHTLSHPDLRNLSIINLEKEVVESKKILEQKLGKEITDFCYPSGKYNSDVLKEVQAAGYKTAVTTVSGVSILKSDPYLIKRLRITQGTDIQRLLSKL